jgi:hypothetical protein
LALAACLTTYSFERVGAIWIVIVHLLKYRSWMLKQRTLELWRRSKGR